NPNARDVAGLDWPRQNVQLIVDTAGGHAAFSCRVTLVERREVGGKQMRVIPAPRLGRVSDGG
ncbi:MAG TPA: hypothetical protein VKX96_15070, partial [Chloroflexota bacterium]|nr:hypothetical protein [Chloroflexota bacterium]